MQSVIQMRTSMERIGDVMRYPEQPMGEAVLSPGETYEKLSGEILDAYNNQGGAFKRKEDMHRMAEANRAFAHFRF